MNTQYGLHEQQYTIIYNVSFLSLGSSMYAMYNGYYGLSIYPGGAFLTSVNYWRKTRLFMEALSGYVFYKICTIAPTA
jgi:hypothetical protein